VEELVMSMTVFVNNKNYSISNDSNSLLEDGTLILKLNDIGEVYNLNNKELIITTEKDEDNEDNISKTYKFNIASKTLEHLFDKYVLELVYLQNKLLFLDFPDNQEQKKYSVNGSFLCLYSYDFDTKEINLISDKDIKDEKFNGYNDKVYFMCWDDEKKIYVLDINTLRVDEYYNNALSFLVKDDTICILNGEESKFIVRNLNSNSEIIISDFDGIDYQMVNDNLIFVEKKIIYSLNLTTEEKIILGVCEKGEWLDDINNGNIIYTTKGKEYNILEDRSNSKEVKKQAQSNKIEKALLVIIILAIIIFVIVKDK
jgi:hypothetical protein